MAHLADINKFISKVEVFYLVIIGDATIDCGFNSFYLNSSKTIGHKTLNLALHLTCQLHKPFIFLQSIMTSQLPIHCKNGFLSLIK